MSTPPPDNNPQWGTPDAQSEQAGSAPQPGSKFGTTGYDPGASYNAPMAEPKKYSLLKTMTLAGLGLYLLSQIVGLIPLTGDANREAVVDGIEATGQSATPTMIDNAIMVSMVIVAVMALIAVGLYLMVYFGLKKVKGWARITGIVLAIIGVLFTFGGFAMDTSMFGTTFGIISVIISIVWGVVTVYWLVLAFASPVRDYMEQHRA